MNVSFKQFTHFISAADGQRPDQLDEIWKSIFQKKKEAEEDGDLDDESKDGEKRVDTAKKKVFGAKSMLDKKKEEAAARKKELEKKRNDAWAMAKDRVESGRNTARSNHAFTRSGGAFNEGKTAYSGNGHGDWVDDAKSKGYKVKKVSGNLMDGDQTWHAFNDKNEKVGSFTEEEEGRGGWLMEGLTSQDESSLHKWLKKNHGQYHNDDRFDAMEAANDFVERYDEFEGQEREVAKAVRAWWKENGDD